MIEVTGKVFDIKPESKAVVINRISDLKFISYSTKVDDETRMKNEAAIRDAKTFWQRQVGRVIAGKTAATGELCTPDWLRDLIKDETIKDETDPEGREGRFYPIKDELMKLLPNLDLLTKDAKEWPEDFDPFLTNVLPDRT